MPRGWLVAPVIGSGTDEDPYRPQVADRPSADGDRLEFVIDHERSTVALVAYDIADDSDMPSHGGDLLLAESDLNKASGKVPQAARLKALAAKHEVGNSGSAREVLRRIGQKISPTFDERMHLGEGTPPPTGSFLVDTFTATDGTLLSEHSPDTGGKWEGATGITLRTGLVSTAAAVNTYTAYNTAAPAGAEYDVAAVYLKKTTNRDSVSVQARKQGATDTAYLTGWDTTTLAWQLIKRVAGVETLLGEWKQEVPGAAPETVTSMRDAAKKLYVDGVERISSSDNAITAKGFVGVGLQNAGNEGLGIKLDSLTATDAGGKTVEGSASLVGTGTLASTAIRESLASAPLSGSGDLSASALRIALGSAPLSGSGVLGAAAIREALGAASLAGTGSLSASAIREAIAAAELLGQGILSATGETSAKEHQTVEGSANLTGSGLLSASAIRIALGAAALAGTGSLEAAGIRVVQGAAELAGQGMLSAQAIRASYGEALLVGIGALSATGQAGPAAQVAYLYLLIDPDAETNLSAEPDTALALTAQPSAHTYTRSSA